jgi:hypothetical protein
VVSGEIHADKNKKKKKLLSAMQLLFMRFITENMRVSTSVESFAPTKKKGRCQQCSQLFEIDHRSVNISAERL